MHEFCRLEKTVSENLKAEIYELKNLEASNECVVSELTDRNSLLTQNIETLKNELSISNKKSAELGEEITYYKTELFSLNSQILSDEKTIEKLRLIEKEYNILLESHKNCEDIEAKLEILNEMYAKLELDNKSLRSEYNGLKEDQHRLRVEYDKDVKDWKNLEKRLKNTNNEIKIHFESKLAEANQNMVLSLEKKDTLLKDLSSELRKQLEISEALKADLKDVQQNYQHEKIIAGSLRAEVHELENLHSSNLCVVSELGESNAALTQNLEALKSELSDSNNKIEKLEEAIASYKSELFNLNAKLLSNKKRIEELVLIDEEYKVLLESHKKCDEIKVKLISLNEIHAQLLLDNESLRCENSAVKQDLHKLHVNYDKAAKNWANLEKELKKDNNENKIDFEMRLTVLNQKMVSSLEKKDGLLQGLSSECELLRKQLEMYETLKMDLENVQKNYQLEKTASENVKAEVHELRNLKASNECVISELIDRNSLLTQNIENLKYELSISNKKSAELGEEITYYKTELSSLNSQILSDEKTIEKLRLIKKEYNVFLESHRNCEDIKAKLEFLNEMYANLELGNKSLRSENDALKEDQCRLHVEYDKAMKDWKNLEKGLKNMNNEIKIHFESKLAVAKQEMVLSLEKKDTLLKDLSSELRKQLEISEALKADLKDVQQNYQHEKIIAGSLRAEIHELENLHSSNLCVVSELCERNAALTQNLEALKSELSVSNNKIEKLEEAIAGYKSGLFNLNAKLLSNEKRIEELVLIDEEYKVLLESHKKCDEIKVKLISLNEIHAQLLLDNESLRCENSAVKQDLNKLLVNSEEAAKNWANLEKELKNDNNETKIDFEKRLAVLNQEMHYIMVTASVMVTGIVMVTVNKYNIWKNIFCPLSQKTNVIVDN
ncbi:uncharacterized protein LOC142317611 [Lycorma delicatula]|uniref:uncharacterized protein LOC142317611 n=1 Tax=Lycorma delicatula TaxID=130591 RepID=UPI003F50F143